MTDSIEILPAVIPKDAGTLGEAVWQLNTFASWTHLDITDGIFTENFSWPFSEKGTIGAGSFMLPPGNTEVHLMVHDPAGMGSIVLGAGAKRIIAHIECFADAAAAKSVLADWRARGVEVGIAILLDTPLSALEGIAEECDCIQVMSIAKIGAQGASFDARAFDRVSQLHQKYPHTVISVDGGVSTTTIVQLIRMGARRFAVGSSIVHAKNAAEAYQSLVTMAGHALS